MLIKDYKILKLFKEMAYTANEPYCKKENDDIIGKGFIGLEVTKSQMEKIKFTLGNFFPDMGVKSNLRIDSNWWNSWPEDCLTSVNDKIEASINTLKNGTEANKPIHVFLTGHGIGGFYAQIYGIYLTLYTRYDEKIAITIITFGSPRPRDVQLEAEFQQKLEGNLRVYRITHSNDYFPHFPKKSRDDKPYMYRGTEYWIPDRNCNCEDPDASRLLGEGYDIIYECPGFSRRDKKKYDENQGCNLGTDGEGIRAHYGPYFGVTFGNCENNYPIGRI
ncbi:hypothetical protein G9A89_001455 [Geosiphon pyriformis]|nr:hypothetical protein G9A89_001455 [Geosiphon pyriformis]